jgi:hypothetical protein
MPQANVISQNARKKKSQVAQWIDFEVNSISRLVKARLPSPACHLLLESLQLILDPWAILVTWLATPV